LQRGEFPQAEPGNGGNRPQAVFQNRPCREMTKTGYCCIVKIKDEDVIQALTVNGTTLDRWLSLGSHLVGYLDESGGLMARIIEDEALAVAASKMLQKRGQIHNIKRV
jgi:hypothetical protein